MINSDDDVYPRRIDVEVSESGTKMFSQGETTRVTEMVVEDKPFCRYEKYGQVEWNTVGDQGIGRVDDESEILLEALYQSTTDVETTEDKLREVG